MTELVGAVISESFLQDLLLLLSAALITGLLVPIVKGRADDRKFREQRVFESELARQTKVIESQAKLLEDLSEMLWSFLLLSLEVTYYAQQPDSETKFENACRKYDESSWEYFARIRSEISKARRLTSSEIYEALLDVNHAWFMQFDGDLTRMMRTHDLDDKGWETLHLRIYREGVPKIDGVLTELAQQLQLTEGDVRVR